MEKVLLAIDGIAPSKKAFNYAVQLCKRIRADLNVLQIIRPKKYSKYLESARKKTNTARKYIEGSMMAAAFAETGEYETAKDMMSEALRNLKQLLPESEKAGIQCHLTMKAGNPKHAILNYLNEHRDVVLTIYDTAQDKRDQLRSSRQNEIKQALSVPLVVVRDH
jgi:nucleotide-binding universal stress UspA family protein